MDHDVALHAAARAAALWTALLLLLLLVLSLLVVRQRQTHKVIFGDGDGAAPQLAQAIRAFGNAAEYTGPGIGALVAMAAVAAPQLAVHICGGFLLTGRVAHAIGLSLTGEASILRNVGMLLTWVAYIFGVVALMIFAVA
jgi:uncharacterized membrane protein YecN with MAPEG domain